MERFSFSMRCGVISLGRIYALLRERIEHFSDSRNPVLPTAIRVVAGVREFKIAVPTRHFCSHERMYMRMPENIYAFPAFAYDCINYGAVTFLLLRMHKALEHVPVFAFIDLRMHVSLPGTIPASVIRSFTFNSHISMALKIKGRKM